MTLRCSLPTQHKKSVQQPFRGCHTPFTMPASYSSAACCS
nr:MAG TPA: hypothetical protein [Caudoviricetes sp.]